MNQSPSPESRPSASEVSESFQQKLDIAGFSVNEEQVDNQFNQAILDLQSTIEGNAYLSPQEKDTLLQEAHLALQLQLSQLEFGLISAQAQARAEMQLSQFSAAVDFLKQLTSDLASNLETAADRDWSSFLKAGITAEEFAEIQQSQEQITSQLSQQLQERVNSFFSDPENQNIWTINQAKLAGLSPSSEIYSPIDFVTINTSENLRNPDTGELIRVATAGEVFQVVGDCSSHSNKYQYKRVIDAEGNVFKLCINDGDNVQQGTTGVVENKEQPSSPQWVVVEQPENLRDPETHAVIRRSNTGERFAVIGELPPRGKFQYKLVRSSSGEEFKICTNDGDRVRIETDSSENLNTHPDEQYSRTLNVDMPLENSTPVYQLSAPPIGYRVEKSPINGSFQSFLENYPVGEGELKYEPKTIEYLMSQMPTKESMDELMGNIRRDLIKVARTEKWSTERVGRSYLGNNFNNAELLAMVAGWMAGKDVRSVNYYKSLFTEGKLNLNVLNNQDCVDACLRLRVEYLITQGNFQEIQKMGLNINEGMNSEQIDKSLSDYFLTTHTSSFARRYNQIGSRMSDEEITNSETELEVGDFITFNKKGGLGGHTVLIMAKAKNEDGDCVYRIATSTLPATEMALYKGWINKKDLLGGSSLTNHISNIPGLSFISLIADKGIKTADYTVSIGSLNMRERQNNVQLRMARAANSINNA